MIIATVVRACHGACAAAARAMMSAWMARPENINTPYPSIAERHTFVAVGGITDRQVLDWFSNNRKRHWKVRVCVRGVARAQCAGCYSSCAHGIANQPLPLRRRSGNTWSRVTRPRLQDGARKRRG